MFLNLLFLFINFSFAGEVKEKGSVLTTQSYVFTIEEAKNLMNRLDSLEQETAKQKELIEQYKNLDLIQEQQNTNLNDLLALRNLQIEEYQKIHYLDLERIKTLNRQKSLSKLEGIGMFTLGIGISIGSVLVADKLDDSLEN